jgi:NitT/TauT family transport system substrate-binding protein
MGSLSMFRPVLSLVSALVFAAASASPAAADTRVKFSLDAKLEGPAAPFFVALDKGYYRAEKLSVAIDPAASFLDPINRVASGDYEMGVADINALIKFRDANPASPVKAVFIVYNKPPYAIVARKSRGISKPKDLEGKKLGAPLTDLTYAQWPIFVRANDIDAAKVTVVNIGGPVREPMLAAGQIDAVTSRSFTTPVTMKDRGVPADDITVMQMSDYGVALYGNAIIVNTKFATDNPDAVKGFLRAFLKGLKETVRSPTGAIESVVKRDDLLKKPVELDRLTLAVRDNILTPEVKANGYGGVDKARFERALEQLGQTYKFKAPAKAEDAFDPSFLPPEADRKAR